MFNPLQTVELCGTLRSFLAQLPTWSSKQKSTLQSCAHEQLQEHVRGKSYSEILMTLEDKVDDASLNATGPDLKVVTTMTSVSLDHLSSPALAKRGIIATNINEIPSLL